MPTKNLDLHGSAPDKADVALLLIDVINDLDFPEADDLLRFALPMADRIAGLKRRAKAAKVPLIYVNDKFGRWQSNLQKIVEHASRPESKGRAIVERLRPEDDDYFVLKPKHSGFFSTTLDVLLDYLQVETVILAGIAANICVLFTANDAYMRDYRGDRPERLRRLEHRGQEPSGARRDGRGPQGRHPSLDRVDVPTRRRQSAHPRTPPPRRPLDGVRPDRVA
jgi:nicotinamidase-related amidase